MNWLEWAKAPFQSLSDTQDDLSVIRHIVAGLPGRLALMEETIMATQADIQAQIAEANEDTNNIAGDVERLKAKIDQVLADQAEAIDEAVAASLQEVSDGLAPLGARLRDVAASTPEEEPA